MADKIAHLDCCSDPLLKTARRLRRTAHETESIRRCKNCGAYWYYHLRELPCTDDEADRCLWCARLTEEQGAHALDRGKPEADLAFLHTLAGCVQDGEGVRRLKRKPPQ
jgi:hypothetical protein